jgi:hypothetical protein
MQTKLLSTPPAWDPTTFAFSSQGPIAFIDDETQEIRLYELPTTQSYAPRCEPVREDVRHFYSLILDLEFTQA